MTDRDRREALVRRVATMDGTARAALVRALGLDGPPRLVACVVPAQASPPGAELEAFLRERLPDPMVPSRLVRVDALPRTPAGKLDRAAVDPSLGRELDGPPETAETGFVPPRDETERTLVEIWQEVLGLDEIGVHDDFFELGGDSLLSIRAISRAGRAGLPIRPDDFFDRPTISGLAEVVRGAGEAAAQETPDVAVDPGDRFGEAPLTPIQAWFFETVTIDPHHWNQSLLLQAPRALGRAGLRESLVALWARHDALRVRFRDDGEGRRQIFEPAVGEPPWEIVDPEAFRTAAERAHRSLDPAAGVLFRVVVEDGPEGFRILLVAHHLAVDEVSWSVLAEDLATLVQQSIEGRSLRLPPPTAAPRSFALGLARRAAAADLAEAPAPTAPRDVSGLPPAGTHGEARRLYVTLEGSDTDALRERARGGSGRTIEAFLLAAVARAWTEWRGAGPVRLDVEGHGRDVPGVPLDVSRTVGWFTRLYPLSIAEPRDVHHALDAVEEALRSRRLGGAAHGLLRWLHPDASVREAAARRPPAPLLVNYLGITEGALGEDAPLRALDGAPGTARSPRAPRAYPLEVNARLAEGRLTLAVDHAPGTHPEHDVRRFAEGVLAALRRLAASDSAARPAYELSGLDRSGLDRLAALLGDEDDDGGDGDA